MGKIIAVCFIAISLSGCYDRAIRYYSEDVIHKDTYLRELENCLEGSEYIASQKFSNCTVDSYNIALK